MMPESSNSPPVTMTGIPGHDAGMCGHDETAYPPYVSFGAKRKKPLVVGSQNAAGQSDRQLAHRRERSHPDRLAR
jgi:hypothetical protein